MAKQQMPPVAQFSLPDPSKPAPASAKPSIKGMPPVAQFSLPDAPTGTPSQPESLGQKALNVTKKVGDFFFPIVGDVYHDIKGDSTKTALQQTGDAALSVLPFIPGLGEVGLAGKAVEGARAVKGAEVAGQAAKGILPQFLKGTVAKNAAVGYGTGVASNLSQGKSIGESVKPGLNTIGGAVVGGATAGVLKNFSGGAGGLKASAQEDISKVLSPTTKVNKQITQKIAPRLSGEGIVATSREGLLGKYQAKMQGASDALEAEYEKLPPDAKFEVSNLFETLNKKIDSLVINGSIPSAAKARVEALQKMGQDLLNIGTTVGPDGVFTDVQNIRGLRQIIDDSIQQGKKNFSPSEFDSASLEARKILANNIRAEFAKQYPDIGKINKDFSFWNKAVGVLSDAIERKTGQTGLIRHAAGAVTGAVVGGNIGHPIISPMVGDLLSNFISSPAWHTTSALIKSKIANAIEKGDSVGLGKIIKEATKILPGLGAVGTQGLINQVAP